MEKHDKVEFVNRDEEMLILIILLIEVSTSFEHQTKFPHEHRKSSENFLF